ncbi:MAG: VRR-NUC domain-containing protein [Oscillospiraceae bacterium]|nr:VRR-NUC domain-containing protein [Oscillospiraceae bacterium]
MVKKEQSVEPDIANLCNGWLKEYGRKYKLEHENLNTEIDQALNEYYSKSGGNGGNRPDAKLLLEDKYGDFYPVLIEYKGYKDKLVKLDNDGIVANKTEKNEPNFKNINAFAVNGAVHYANAILHYTTYTKIIAIGVTGYRDAFDDLHHEIGVYYVSSDKGNLGYGQKVGEYQDLSFLKEDHFDEFIEKNKKPQSFTGGDREAKRKARERNQYQPD